MIHQQIDSPVAAWKRVSNRAYAWQGVGIAILNLLPNLKTDAMAEKLLCNLVRFAQATLPQA